MKEIDARVDAMLQEGLVDEVSLLAKKGYTKDMVSMQGLGYKEICLIWMEAVPLMKLFIS